MKTSCPKQRKCLLFLFEDGPTTQAQVTQEGMIMTMSEQNREIPKREKLNSKTCPVVVQNKGDIGFPKEEDASLTREPAKSYTFNKVALTVNKESAKL